MLLAGELDCLAVTKCLVKVQAVSADVRAVCGYRLPGFACDVLWLIHWSCLYRDIDHSLLDDSSKAEVQQLML
jgi:hypothetical protein